MNLNLCKRVKTGLFVDSMIVKLEILFKDGFLSRFIRIRVVLKTQPELTQGDYFLEL